MAGGVGFGCFGVVEEGKSEVVEEGLGFAEEEDAGGDNEGAGHARRLWSFLPYVFGFCLRSLVEEGREKMLRGGGECASVRPSSKRSCDIG